MLNDQFAAFIPMLLQKLTVCVLLRIANRLISHKVMSVLRFDSDKRCLISAGPHLLSRLHLN